jgi:SAM-dependent methyltransferase
MGTEKNLMVHYPKSHNRKSSRPVITESDREISRRFGKDYFDGARSFGYGGYFYDPKFWTETVATISSHYALNGEAKILDVGCAKGFMLRDFKKLLPECTVAGIDISEYAIENAHPEVKEFLVRGNATELPFNDESFDLVLSINTIHNLDLKDCTKALAEIERVTKANSFIVVDGWKTQIERNSLESWVVSARTILSAHDWLLVFQESGYTGDYAFWTP